MVEYCSVIRSHSAEGHSAPWEVPRLLPSYIVERGVACKTSMYVCM